MVLDGILKPYSSCKVYPLSDEVSGYLTYITEEPFYVPPMFNEVKTDVKLSSLKPKFVLFSAPGATGKSTLAKYIANRYNAIYWDLAKVKIGTNSFAGSVLNAVGAPKYSDFIKDLNSGRVLLVIDAFDEAEIVSGRKMINSFLSDISNSLSTHTTASVFLLARTETAQFIASFCAENNIAVAHYEIGFFNEETAKQFIVKSAIGKRTPLKPDFDCATAYYDVIKNNITETERASFLGYAPVLEAISAHIRATPNRNKLISELGSQKDCVSIIMRIMDDLLEREQKEKVVPAFEAKCKESHPEFSEWERVFSPIEQLVRIIYFILFDDKRYDNYQLDFLPPQLIDEYQRIIDSYIAQNPFVRSLSHVKGNRRLVDFTGPAFRDYALVKLILDENHEALADMYFEESQSQSYFPSQIFFDCYTTISDFEIKPNHISYVYDSYRAKATAYERAYLQCTEMAAEPGEGHKCLSAFGMIAGKSMSVKHDDVYAFIQAGDGALQFDKLINVSIDTPEVSVCIGRPAIDAQIYNSSVIAKQICWGSKSVTIESYAPEGCLLVSHEGFSGETVSIEITKGEKLRVCSPNINSYYKLKPYEYDFEDPTNYDIIKFIHALRCILVEFRTHKKDTLAKTAERIEFVTVGNSDMKRRVLEYMKDVGIIYTADHLYKIDEAKMQEKKISFNALSRMDTALMMEAFQDFCKWAQ